MKLYKSLQDLCHKLKQQLKRNGKFKKIVRAKKELKSVLVWVKFRQNQKSLLQKHSVHSLILAVKATLWHNISNKVNIGENVRRIILHLICFHNTVHSMIIK